MPIEWIKAPLALAYLSDRPNDIVAQRRICERARGGLIAAKAERLVWNGNEERNHLIGKNFWAADWEVSLKQDWGAGDFAVLVDQQIEAQAFGVSFDFGALSELVPVEEQAAALRRISVLANDDWIDARELAMAVMKKFGPASGTEPLIEACRLGQLGARAMRAVGKYRQGGIFVPRWTAIEWDVPLWFWRDLTKARGSARFEWSVGKVTGDGRRDGVEQMIELQGVHFHRSGLINLGLAPVPDSAGPLSEARRGRKPEYDWPATTAAIWGQIFRGELIPDNQAAIERAFQSLLRKGDKEPSESTVRPYAQPIWEQISKA